MDKEEAIALLHGGKEGIEEWNRRRDEFEKIPKQFHVDLSNVSLSNVNLSRVDLTDSVLSGSNLFKANLSMAYLRRTKLYNADLRRADLSKAFLDQANLFKANLSDTNLTAARLSRAKIAKTNFGDTIFTGVFGLDTCEHSGPSYLDYITITNNPNLPQKFLRGCGLSDVFIEYLPSLTHQPIQYYSCFISYSSNDHEFAERLCADLQNKGIRCWFAPEDMKIGDKIRVRIDESIRLHDKLLLILSDESVNSDWVEKEVETTFEKERNVKETALFPVRLDNAIMDIPVGWAADIRRTRHIGDFRQWKSHDEYKKAFEKLVKDLTVDNSTNSE